MRKLPLLPLLLLAMCMTSCVTTRVAQYIESPSMTDFRPYSEDGFFISPGMEGINYKPIGLVSMTFSPGVMGGHISQKYASYSERMSTAFNQEIYEAYGYRTKSDTSNNTQSTNVQTSTAEPPFFQPNETYMLERIVYHAKQFGATGLLNFKISYSYEMPSAIAKAATSDGMSIAAAHAKQTYGTATVTAFAVEVIK